MRPKMTLDVEKKKAIDIAAQLCYNDDVKKKIEKVKTSYEIDRILKQARLEQA